ncbi:VOC family protein [Crossiella cryophila]|uniref:Catechol 2,3-dioxygenase-like lactoylglutathione lyase family enzyme n=1 Tax=Crossiella cryophila TaxID=43355 RepID=A0A7W7CFT0_9PSEU|nr:VOC family protein [Crossiella cryophila]MBB4680310.1 catechol 2,3-dioxygenase-like lactoylglutathione lyase family enzyme [Crossiella cryophila]
MTITLNHLIIPVADRWAGSRFLARLIGGEPVAAGPFAALRVNAGLTLDFADDQPVAAGHYAFLLDEARFDALLAVLATDRSVDYGSGVEHGWDRRTNSLGGGRGVYVRDPDGHSYEFFTAVP